MCLQISFDSGVHSELFRTVYQSINQFISNRSTHKTEMNGGKRQTELIHYNTATVLSLTNWRTSMLLREFRLKSNEYFAFMSIEGP